MPIAHAAEPLTIAFAFSPEDDPAAKWIELLYTEAFRRAGAEFRYAVYPAKRCSIMANAGKVDGEALGGEIRIASFPNLIKVPEAVVSTKIAAFTARDDIRVDGWESLRDTSWRIDYIMGLKSLEGRISQVMPPDQVSPIPTREQALKKLRSGRSDIFIGVEGSVMKLLETPEFQDSGIRNAGPVDEFPSYLLLNNTHQELAPKLAEALRQMKAEGLFESYLKQAMP